MQMSRLTKPSFPLPPAHVLGPDAAPPQGEGRKKVAFLLPEPAVFAPLRDAIVAARNTLPTLAPRPGPAFANLLGRHPAVAVPALAGLTFTVGLTGAQRLVPQALRAITAQPPGLDVPWRMSCNVLCLYALRDLFKSHTATLGRDRAALLGAAQAVCATILGYWICVRLLWQGHDLIASVVAPQDLAARYLANFGTEQLAITLIVLSLAPLLATHPRPPDDVELQLYATHHEA